MTLMTDSDNAPADIAWLRQLAEENGTGPMRGASILRVHDVREAMEVIRLMDAMSA